MPKKTITTNEEVSEKNILSTDLAPGKELNLSDEDVTSKKGEIEFGDPMDLRPQSLPIVVKVPESASSAQKEYAKILNAYAYTNPEKYEAKKDVLRKRMALLKGKEVVIDENKKLSINKSTVSFTFLKPKGGDEIYAGTQ